MYVNIIYRKVALDLKNNVKLLQSVSESDSLDVVVRYVETDDSYALCCLFLHTQLG